MSDEPDGYHTYLLRVWRAQYSGRWLWRASLENPRTGERLTFATLDELCRYIESGPVPRENAWDPELDASPSAGGH